MTSRIHLDVLDLEAFKFAYQFAKQPPIFEERNRFHLEVESVWESLHLLLDPFCYLLFLSNTVRISVKVVFFVFVVGEHGRRFHLKIKLKRLTMNVQRGAGRRDRVLFCQFFLLRKQLLMEVVFFQRGRLLLWWLLGLRCWLKRRPVEGDRGWAERR